MDFLKEVIGEELFTEVKSKIDEYNKKIDDKEQQMKLANLGQGKYVSIGKYYSLKKAYTHKTKELYEMKKILEKVNDREKSVEMCVCEENNKSEIERLQKELEEEKVKSAVKFALLSSICKEGE